MNQAGTLHNSAGQPGAAAGGRGLGLSLLVIATAQLMLVLDDTIANIALPSIQRDLGVSASTLPWIVNAYVLVFGALLLFGGRVGDLFGRRRVLRIGLVLFTVASLLGGSGLNAGMLIAARGLQGVGAALVAPNVLALIATTFPVGKPRNTAMAVYAAMSAVGITVGVLLGGVLTGLLSWRWVFLINVPIGLCVLAGTRVLVEGQRSQGRLNTFDAVSGTGAMVALAYGITRGGEHGWGDVVTLGSFVVAAVLMAVFLSLQARREHPMLPLGLFRDRNRSGSYAAVLFIGGGLMATYYLLTLYMQQVLEFTPVMAGLASLPVAFGIVLSAGVSPKLVERLAPRAVAAPGAAGGGRGPVLALDARGGLLIRLACPARALRHLLRPGDGLHADDAHRGPRRHRGVGGRRLGDDQHGAAARRGARGLRAGDHLNLGSQRAAARSGRDPSGRPDGKRHERPGEGRRGADPRLHNGLPRRGRDAAGGGRHRDRGRQHPADPRIRGGGVRRLIRASPGSGGLTLYSATDFILYSST